MAASNVRNESSQTVIGQLLQEFNSPAAPNARKREIESELRRFQEDEQSWRQCLFHLTEFAAQYLWFFNISTVEMVITRRWSSTSNTDRTTIRETLWHSYVALAPSAPHIQRNKIAQLIALIGKREFPDEHTAYMHQIFELLQTNLPAGIVLLRSTSEEITSTRDDVSSDRKKYFHSCMSLCMAECFELLTKFLPLFVYWYEKKELHGPDIDPALVAAIPADHLSQSCVEYLLCMQQLFSWICVDQFVSEYLLTGLFQLSKWHNYEKDIAVGALSALSELFYRQRAIPLPMVIANGVMQLLQQETTLSGFPLEIYQDKFTELLRLFTTQSWAKWIDDDLFPTLLNYLYRYTCSAYGALAFTERLTIWTPIVNGLLAANGFGRYTKILLALSSSTLEIMQFRKNLRGEFLEVLDNEVLDDDMKTEWQHFLTQCIECIALIAQGNPIEVFQQVVDAWNEPFESFTSLEKMLSATTGQLQDASARIGQNELQLVSHTFRDFSSLCQTIARLSIVRQACTNEASGTVNTVTLKLCNAVRFGATQSLCSKLACLTDEVNAELNETFAQMLATLMNLIQWSDLGKSEPDMTGFVDTVVQRLLLPADKPVPSMIQLAAAQFLLRISATMQLKYFVDIPGVRRLIQAGPHLPGMTRIVTAMLHKAICNCFVLPWPNIPTVEQNFEMRADHLQQYVACLAHDLLQLNEHDTNTMTAVTSTVLHLLKDILDYYHDASTMVKQMLARAFKPIITKAVAIFLKLAMHDAKVADAVLTFSLSAIRTLQMQLGIAFIKELLAVFIDSSTQQCAVVTPIRVNAIDKLLQMLAVVVEQPGNGAAALLPSILTLALEHVAPFLKCHNRMIEHSDLATSLYALLNAILLHRWQYFYKSQVSRGFSPGASDIAPPPSDDAASKNTISVLVKILELYGHAICAGQSDPHCTLTVLTSMHALVADA